LSLGITNSNLPTIAWQFFRYNVSLLRQKGMEILQSLLLNVKRQTRTLIPIYYRWNIVSNTTKYWYNYNNVYIYKINIGSACRFSLLFCFGKQLICHQKGADYISIGFVIKSLLTLPASYTTWYGYKYVTRHNHVRHDMFQNYIYDTVLDIKLKSNQIKLK
jgi:hypothetical protein